MQLDLTGARLDDERDPLGPARGLVVGLALGLVLWFALLGLVAIFYATLVLFFGAGP